MKKRQKYLSESPISVAKTLDTTGSAYKAKDTIYGKVIHIIADLRRLLLKLKFT